MTNNPRLDTLEEQMRTLAVLPTRLDYIEKMLQTISATVADTNKRMEESFISKKEFMPVRLMVYGIAGTTLSVALGKILTNIFK